MDQDYLEAVPSLIDATPWVLVTSSGWIERGAVKDLMEAAVPPEDMVGDVPENPPVSFIEKLTGVKRNDLIVALGGGSVMDAAKGLAVVQALKGDMDTLHAHLKEGEPLPPDLRLSPVICVPTTSGTGSEVTPWATIWGDEKVKFSLNDPRLYPQEAILDPRLCLSMPRELTLSSGLDALSHAMESVWNNNHTPLSDQFAETAIRMLRAHFQTALESPDDVQSRREMQVAATTAGLAMGTTQTALSHSISYPFTALFGMPHGLACSFTLPAVAEYNLGHDPGRLEPIARGLECDPQAIPEVIQAWFDGFKLGSELKRYVSVADIDNLGDKLITRARAKNNLRDVDGPTAKDIARRSLIRHFETVGEIGETAPGEGTEGTDRTALGDPVN